MIIYKITNKINGKIYVGQTTRSIHVRWKEHCKDKRACKALFLAIGKYGKENFEISVIEICHDIEEMNEKESFYISSLNSLVPNGYNLRSGGLNSLMSNESKIKMSISHTKEKNVNFGKSPNNETRQKISDSNKGKTRSEFFKNNRSEYMKKNNPQFDMTQIKLDRLFSYNESKKVKILCIQNQSVYDSISEAARILQISKGNISGVLSGKYSQTNGFTFKRIS
jgi:group I intron endonuclease